jgi:hypothetical protein
VLLFGLRDSTEQEVSRSLPVDRQNVWCKKAQDYFPTEAEQRGSHNHWLALMTTRKKKKTTALDREAIDRLVISESDDDSAWEAPICVKQSKRASLSIPGELAARAAFLAKLHRESRVDNWVERVVRERVELEELAFAEAKKKLAS